MSDHAESKSPVHERDSVIDALKGLAIIAVVLGHEILMSGAQRPLGTNIVAVLVSFNMPLFMFLSGYLLLGREGTDPIRFVKRKFLRLMVPYLAWLGFYAARSAQSPVGWLKTVAYGAVVPFSTKVWTPWFLFALFAFYVVFALLRSVSRSDWMLIGGACAAGSAVAVLPILNPSFGAYYGYAYADHYLFPFFIGGYLFAKHRSRIKGAIAKGWVAAAAAAAFVLLLQAPKRVLPHIPFGGSAVAILLKYAAAAVAIIGLYCAYSVIQRRGLSPQALIGRMTLGIFVLNPLFVPLYPFGRTALGIAAGTSLTIILSSAVVLLIERSTLLSRVLLGNLPRAKVQMAPTPLIPATEAEM